MMLAQLTLVTSTMDASTHLAAAMTTTIVPLTPVTLFLDVSTLPLSVMMEMLVPLTSVTQVVGARPRPLIVTTETFALTTAVLAVCAILLPMLWIAMTVLLALLTNAVQLAVSIHLFTQSVMMVMPAQKMCARLLVALTILSLDV